MMKSVMIALALTLSSPALAQDVPLDATLVASSKALLDVLMPPAKREAMIEGIMRGMMTNITQMMTSSPEMTSAFGGDERATAIFDKFMKRQQEDSIKMLKDNFPGMMDAMTNAYARRFTTTQLGEMRTFFETPTGQIYVDQAATIMSDPDILKWQRDLMAKGFSRIPKDIEAMMAEIKALKPKAKTGG
jgi:hypothetical protein